MRFSVDDALGLGRRMGRLSEADGIYLTALLRSGFAGPERCIVCLFNSRGRGGGAPEAIFMDTDMDGMAEIVRGFAETAPEADAADGPAMFGEGECGEMGWNLACEENHALTLTMAGGQVRAYIKSPRRARSFRETHPPMGTAGAAALARAYADGCAACA